MVARTRDEGSLVFLLGLPSLAISFLGTLSSMFLLILGPVLGAATLALFARLPRPRGGLAVAGVVLGLLAIALPAGLILILLSWNSD